MDVCDNATFGNNASNSVIPENYKPIVAILSSLLALVIFVGNGLIIVSVCVVKKLRQPANYLIVSLAFSDFLVALVVLPFAIVVEVLGEWVFGPTMCNIHLGFDVICCATSILNLVMISIDRYLMVTRPLTYPKRRTAKLMIFMICSAWILACLVIFPALFGFTHNVTGDPSWIKFKHKPPGLNDSLRDLPIATKDDPIVWRPCQSSQLVWQHVVDLKQEFNVTKLKVEIPSDNDTVVRFQMEMMRQNTSQEEYFDFQLRSSTVVELTNTTAQYIRILLKDTQRENASNVSFDIFGEVIHNKPCLISQEPWFAVYSTLCSFYIPLSIMLFMYYKIFQEASRFKARQTARSRSLADQPGVNLSRSLRRRGRGSVDFSDSSSDLLDYSHDIRRRKEFSNVRNSSSRREAVISASFSTAKTAPGSVSSPVRDNEILQTVSTSREDARFCSVAPSADSIADVCGNSRSSEPRIQQHCNGRGGTKRMLRSDEGKSLEVNDNVPDEHKASSAHDAHWCKCFQTIRSDAARKQNGRFDAAKRKNERKENPLSSFVREGRSLFSVKRKSNRCRNSQDQETKSRRSVHRKFLTSSHRERLRNAKAVRTLGIIVAAFTFCWLPLATLTILRPFVCENPKSDDCVPRWLERLVLWLGYVNSALNPFIYVGFSPDLRDTFRFLICCKCTNVDRRLAQIELRQAIEHEKKHASAF